MVMKHYQNDLWVKKDLLNDSLAFKHLLYPIVQQISDTNIEFNTPYIDSWTVIFNKKEETIDEKEGYTYKLEIFIKK